jgi:peptidoglycan hydrolase FlgJ
MIAPVNHRGAVAPKSDLRQAAEGFEAIMLRQMLAAARATSFGNDLLGDGAGEDTFAEMRDAHFADLAAGSGLLGFAATIEAQLARHGAAQEI